TTSGTNGVAKLGLTFGAGSHTVKAIYVGDANFIGSTSNTLTVNTNCWTTISSDVAGGNSVTHRTTRVVRAAVNGGMTLAQGAGLDLEGATVKGGMTAYQESALRVCGSTVQAMTVTASNGFVVIGDPGGFGHATPNNDCAANTVGGNIQAIGNSHGLVIVG